MNTSNAEDAVECPHCNGGGTIYRSIGPFTPAPPYSDDCPECDGTGEVEPPIEKDDTDWKALALEDTDAE